MRDTFSRWMMRPALMLGLAMVAACAGSSPGGHGDDDDDDDDGDGGIVVPTPDASFECDSTDLGTVTFEKIATWKDDAKGAYSFIHDDYCDPSVVGIAALAIPQLNERGIHAGVGAIAGACEEEGVWDQVVAAEASGHEIVNHSYTHPEITPANMQHEVVEAKALLEQHTEKPVTFFIFPYDFFTTETINAVKNAGHLGSRSGVRDDNDGNLNPPINGAAPDNDYAVEFDVWPRSYSKYARYADDDMLQVHVMNAADRGGWAMREFHSVIADDEAHPENHGFGPIKMANYKKHLDFLAEQWRGGYVWTDTPSAVLRYRHAREACKASVDGQTIKFDASDADCQKYATPISVIVKTEADLAGIGATQGGATVSTKKLEANTFSVTADPTKGDVALSGCTNEGPHREDIPAPTRPPQAASVCDLETVVGTGSPGKMDDLERPAEQFQSLPNPSQADGRTGTWSWYPQGAHVAQVADGSGHVLKYSGSNLANWTGVTLAFLGGNGAGSCYDGSSYTGIKFRIKGSVTATDELNGKVVVSIVTAKTQTVNYGGDLEGEGGHFHKIVPVTSGWTTVELPFASLDKPTWGDTVTLTAVAKDALQAIDWGISNTASTFDIQIDDIQMY